MRCRVTYRRQEGEKGGAHWESPPLLPQKFDVHNTITKYSIIIGL